MMLNNQVSSNKKSEFIKECWEYWQEFVNVVMYENRFVPKHELLDELKEFVIRSSEEISKDSIYYRSRIVNLPDLPRLKIFPIFDEISKSILLDENENIHLNVGEFRGYDINDSFIPPIGTKTEGRANPKYLPLLYVSEQLKTSINEVRPLLNDYVSVAQIINIEPLKIIDLTRYGLTHDINEKDARIKFILNMISSNFSRPTYNTDDYILTQFIALYIKSLGFDALKFKSSLNAQGTNLIIFSYKKCLPINSQVFFINDIKYEIKHFTGL